MTELPYWSANFVTWWFSSLVTKLEDFIKKWRIFRDIISSQIFFIIIFWCNETNENVHILKAYSFSLGFWKTLLFTNLSRLFTSCWCFYMFFKRPNALKFVTRNYLREYNFVTPLYTPEREKRIFFKQLLFFIMNLDVNSWFCTVFNFDSLWVNFVKWLGHSKH